MVVVYIGFVSAILLATITIFFVCEVRRGHRLVLASTRASLDRFLDRLSSMFLKWARHLESGALRFVIHASIQRVLNALYRGALWCAAALERILRRHSRVVRRAATDRRDGYLDSIRQHKEASTLSAEDRIALKEQSLEGK